MSDLRKMCSCGHVRGSHLDGAGECFKNVACPCRSWTPAFPVYDAALPTGVAELLHLRSTGLSLVACTHADAGRETWTVLADDVAYASRGTRAAAEEILREQRDLVAKFGDRIRVERTVAPLRPRCPFCLGEPRLTDGYRLPVKRLVFAPTAAALALPLEGV